jgi:hypothetical protein
MKGNVTYRSANAKTIAAGMWRFPFGWALVFWIVVFVALWNAAQAVGYLFPLGSGLALTWGWIAVSHEQRRKAWAALFPALLVNLAALAYAAVAASTMDFWDAFFHIGHLATVVGGGLLLTYVVRQFRRLPSEGQWTVLGSALVAICTLMAMLGLYWAGQNPATPAEGWPSAVAAIYAIALALAIGPAWMVSAALQMVQARRVALAAGALAAAFMAATFFPLEFFGNCAETFFPYALC